MKKPIAVLISDIHFNLNNLELASKSLRAALKKAEDLKVSLIIAGDLNDTKAIIRGEVANELIDILKNRHIEVIVMIGNHDLLNEKGAENSLNFLAPYAHLINKVSDLSDKFGVPIQLIPYHADQEELANYIKTIPKGFILIMHQGVKGAWMGDYVQDKSSIDTKLLSKYKVISGHYHRHQTVGSVTYIGSPYTITFGEATDGDKGFLILNSDGSFERVILDLRRHIIINTDNQFESKALNIRPEDLVWVKISGNSKELASITKTQVSEMLIGHMNFKLEKVYREELITAKVTGESDHDKLDSLIDQVIEEDDRKQLLKDLWRSLV